MKEQAEKEAVNELSAIRKSVEKFINENGLKNVFQVFGYGRFFRVKSLINDLTIIVDIEYNQPENLFFFRFIKYSEKDYTIIPGCVKTVIKIFLEMHGIL